MLNKNTLNINKEELASILTQEFSLIYNSGVNSAHSRIESSRVIYADAKHRSQTNGRSKAINKSYYTSKMVKKEILKLVASIAEPVLQNNRLISVSSLHNSDHAEDVLNYQWNNILNKTIITKEAAKNFFVDGIAIAKVSWIFKKKTTKSKEVIPTMSKSKDEAVAFIKSITNQEKQQQLIDILNTKGSIPIAVTEKEVDVIDVIENRPIIEIIDPLHVVFSKNKDYVYHTYELTYSEVMLRRSEFESQIKFILDVLKGEKVAEPLDIITTDRISTGVDSELFDYLEDIVNTNKNLANKTLKFVDYWGDIVDRDSNVHSVVVTMIGNKIVRLEHNPTKLLPFVTAQLDITPDSPYSEGLPLLLEQEQAGLNRSLRVIDNATINYDNDQKLIDESLFTDITQKNNFNAGRTAYFKAGLNPSTAIYNNSIERLPETVFGVKDFYIREILNSTSERPDSLNPAGTEAEDPIDSVESGRLRNFMELLQGCFTVIAEMNSRFLIHDTKLTKDITIIPELLSMTGASITIDAITAQERDKKASQLINLLSTQSAHMSEETLMNHYIKLAKLWNHHDLAASTKKELETPKPPDPMIELQIENAKLENTKLQIELELIKANAGYYDARAKEQESKAVKTYSEVIAGVPKAEALNKELQARMFESDTQKKQAQTALFNQEFHLVDTGAKQDEDRKKLEFQHMANLEREEIRTKREMELNDKSHKNAKELKDSEKPIEPSKPTQEHSPLVEYIKNGTLKNEDYDTADSVYRDILNKNGLDTSKYYAQNQDKADKGN